MGTGQGKIIIRSGNALDVGETTSNVATNKAELAALAANIDGKDTYPQSVSTQRLQVAQTLSIGDQVQLTDGCVKSNHLTTDSAVITDSLQIGNNVITEDAISVPNLAAVNADLGAISTGTLAIGSGGVAIGSPSAGIGIMNNQIFCKAGADTTILINGADGTITAKKFTLTADANNSIDLSQGTHILATSITVGATTLGGMQTATSNAQSTANTANTSATNAQTTANTALTTAQGRVAADGTYVVTDGNKYITRINTTGGIVISTATSDSGARTQITSAGLACYNSGGTQTVAATGAGGLYVNNASSTPGVTERLSLAYNNTEKGWVGATSAGDLHLVGSAANVSLHASGGVFVYSDASAGGYISIGGGPYPAPTYFYGNAIMGAGRALVFAAGSVDPTITAGSAPSQGSASSEPVGSLKIGTGGSLWITNGSGVWDRIRTYSYNP